MGKVIGKIDKDVIRQRTHPPAIPNFRHPCAQKEDDKNGPKIPIKIQKTLVIRIKKGKNAFHTGYYSTFFAEQIC